MTTHPTQSQEFPTFAPDAAAAAAASSGFIKRLRSFTPLDWILGRKITAQAELTCCRVRATRANCFSRNESFDIQIDYQFWVAGVCHQGQARLPRLPASGHYQSKSEAARAMLQQSSFPITYRTRCPSRSKLALGLPVPPSPPMLKAPKQRP